MIEQRIAQIKAHVERVLSMLEGREEPPKEVQDAIREFLQKSIAEIQQLRQEQEKEKAEIELEEAEQEQAQVANEIEPVPPEQSPPQGPVPPLMPAPYPSSNINAFRYDPKRERLYVKFQGKHPQENGPVYSYEGIPKDIYEVFRRGAIAPKTSGRNAWHRWKKGVTPSHGAAMFALIKGGGFPYQRVQG